MSKQTIELTIEADTREEAIRTMELIIAQMRSREDGQYGAGGGNGPRFKYYIGPVDRHISPAICPTFGPFEMPKNAETVRVTIGGASLGHGANGGPGTVGSGANSGEVLLPGGGSNYIPPGGNAD